LRRRDFGRVESKVVISDEAENIKKPLLGILRVKWTCKKMKEPTSAYRTNQMK
jgi:hypothetical protein